MYSLPKQLQSAITSLWITITRLIDHGYRRVFGLPQYRNSMITPSLFLGGQYGPRGLRKLNSMGITGIVNMRITPIPDKLSFPDMHYLHLPTVDQEAPTVSQLETGVTFIRSEIQAKGKVYIHCRYGEGRGPTMILAYLIAEGLTLNDALKQVQKVRPFIRPTLIQLEQLRVFEKKNRFTDRGQE